MVRRQLAEQRPRLADLRGSRPDRRLVQHRAPAGYAAGRPPNRRVAGALGELPDRPVDGLVEPAAFHDAGNRGRAAAGPCRVFCRGISGIPGPASPDTADSIRQVANDARTASDSSCTSCTRRPWPCPSGRAVAGQDADRGGLAGPVGAEEADDRVGRTVNEMPFDRTSAAIVLAEVADFDHALLLPRFSVSDGLRNPFRRIPAGNAPCRAGCGSRLPYVTGLARFGGGNGWNSMKACARVKPLRRLCRPRRSPGIGVGGRPWKRYVGGAGVRGRRVCADSGAAGFAVV